MPTKEIYEKNKEYYKEYARTHKEEQRFYSKRYYQKHREKVRELAHFSYMDNRQKEIDRSMEYYRKKHPVVKSVRLRKNGEQWPPKTCLNCNNSFIPRSTHKYQKYCSTKCYANHKGYLNLPQYKK